MSHFTLRPLILALALIGTLTGCDDKKPVQTAQIESLPHAGGILKVAFEGDPFCLDPQQTGNSWALNMARQVVDTLTDQDPQSGAIVPWIAKSWEVSADARRFTFHLRDDATFSDGSPVDAAAVKANFDGIVTFAARAPIASAYIAGLESVEVVAPYTVSMTFKTPNAQFLQATSTMSLGLLSPSTLARSGEERCQGKVTGSGPYIYDSFVPNQKATLSRRDDYAWGSSIAGHQGPGWLQGIEFLIIPESGVRLGSLLSGQIDVDTGVVIQDEPTLQARGIALLARTNPGVVHGLAMNESRAPMNERAVRLAVSKGIDRAELKNVLSSFQQTAGSVLARNTPYYSDHSALLGYDPDGSRKLLDDAGWKVGPDGIRERDGKRLSFKVDYWQSTSALELVQQQLKRVGIELLLNKTTFAAVTGQQMKHDYGAAFVSMIRSDPDVLRLVFIATGFNTNVRQPEAVDDALAQAAQTLDPQVRKGLVEQASRLLIEEGHAIPLYEQVTVTGHGQQVRGLRYEATSRLQLFDTWLER